MARRGGRTGTGWAALLLGAALVAACTARPSSQAVESAGPVQSAGAEASASAAPPSEAPASAEASPVATPAPTVKPAPGVPDKPAKVTFTEVGQESVGRGQTRLTYRLAWSAPEGVAASFTVVGVTECLRDASAFHGKPCLVKGMRIPKSVQEVVATVPGSERSVDVSWKVGEIGPGPYFAILIRASNDAGDSIFTIAWSDNVCWQCTY